MNKSKYQMRELNEGGFEITVEGSDLFLVQLAPNMNAAEQMQVLHRLISAEMEKVQAERYAALLRSAETMDSWSKLKKIAKSETRGSEPPALAEAVFSFLTSKLTADAELGDLQELFLKNVDRFGQARARRLYWYEVLQAVRPALFRIAKKLGIYGIVVGYIRAKFNL